MILRLAEGHDAQEEQCRGLELTQECPPPRRRPGELAYRTLGDNAHV